MKDLLTLLFVLFTYTPLLLAVNAAANDLRSPFPHVARGIGHGSLVRRRPPPRSRGNSSSSTATGTPQPTQPGNTDTTIHTIRERRMSSIVGGLSTDGGEGPNNIPSWLSALGSDGKWPDSEVDYTTGCAARRANWPAQDHWLRIVTMAAAWHGGLEGADPQFIKNPALRDAISLAMGYWFSRDYGTAECTDFGGTPRCPCDNPNNYLWNTNWFSNLILIPRLVGQTCLLLDDTLIPPHLENCTLMTGRSYAAFNRPINGISGGILTGANALDVARIGMDNALLTNNLTTLVDAYQRVHLELVIQDTVFSDGIRSDGAFAQHAGMLYNGNYGKDYVNAILYIEIEAAGTELSANATSQSALGTLFDGGRWMVFRNAMTGVLHWDFSVLGRFISFPVADNQATGSININLTEAAELGQLWPSSVLTNFATSLSKSTNNANAGKLEGNRLFYTNDYMVHRGHNYVSTVKTWSSRTRHTECTNSQNPLGYHLADGVLYTYIRGDEYEDIASAWDWNLIPGITVDYGATPLICANTKLIGVEGFVGGVSNERVGISVMRYTNAVTKSLRWQKAWFFLEDDTQHVMVANLSSTSSAPVYSVLDQKRHSGPVVVNGVAAETSNHTDARSLWHGDIGYVFPPGTSLSVQVGEKIGDWAQIGTSTLPPTTVDLFAAWVEHKSLSTPISYTAYPGTSLTDFVRRSKRSRLQSIQNDAHVSAVFDGRHETAFIVFWDSAGGSVNFSPTPKASRMIISSTGNVAIIYKPESRKLTVSDPSQTLSSVNISVTHGNGGRWGETQTTTLTFTLPGGGLAGSPVTQNLQ